MNVTIGIARAWPRRKEFEAKDPWPDHSGLLPRVHHRETLFLTGVVVARCRGCVRLRLGVEQRHGHSVPILESTILPHCQCSTTQRARCMLTRSMAAISSFTNGTCAKLLPKTTMGQEIRRPNGRTASGFDMATSTDFPHVRHCPLSPSNALSMNGAGLITPLHAVDVSMPDALPASLHHTFPVSSIIRTASPSGLMITRLLRQSALAKVCKSSRSV